MQLNKYIAIENFHCMQEVKIDTVSKYQDTHSLSIITVYQRTPDIAIDLSRKLGRGALRGQYFSVFFRVNTLKYSVSNFHSSRLDINEWLLE